MNIVTDLEEIVTETNALLDGIEATATDDSTAAASKVAAGGTSVLVLAAPELEWETWHQVTATWTCWVIVGATTDPKAAAVHMSPVLEALAQPLGLDRARPQTYELASRTWPGYELTFTTQTI